MYVCTYVCMCVCLYVCVYGCMDVCTCICVCVCMYSYLHMYVYLCEGINVYREACMHAQSHTDNYSQNAAFHANRGACLNFEKPQAHLRHHLHLCCNVYVVVRALLSVHTRDGIHVRVAWSRERSKRQTVGQTGTYSLTQISTYTLQQWQRTRTRGGENMFYIWARSGACVCVSVCKWLWHRVTMRHRCVGCRNTHMAPCSRAHGDFLTPYTRLCDTKKKHNVTEWQTSMVL
jgi:hypothetical protein